MSTESLSAEESRYFESGGAEAPVETTETTTAPATTETPAADPKPAEPPANDGTEKDRDRTVPIHALHEERTRRRELQQQFEAMQQKLAAMEAAQKPKEPPAPDFAQDPAGYLKYQVDKVTETLAQRQAREAQEAQQRAQVQQVQQIQQTAATMEREFAAKTPDYADAIGFLKEARKTELSYLVPGADPARIEAMLQADANAVMLHSLRYGINPAEAFYNIAKARGFAPKPKVDPAQEETKKFQALAAGQQHAATLGAANGGAAPPLTIDAVAKMSDDDFAKLSDSEFRKLAGG